MQQIKQIAEITLFVKYHFKIVKISKWFNVKYLSYRSMHIAIIFTSNSSHNLFKFTKLYFQRTAIIVSMTTVDEQFCSVGLLSNLISQIFFNNKNIKGLILDSVINDLIIKTRTSSTLLPWHISNHNLYIQCNSCIDISVASFHNNIIIDFLSYNWWDNQSNKNQSKLVK